MERADRFDELYRENYAAVVRYARRRADPDTAGDVVAETFLIAWRRLDFVPADPAAAQPWLYGVARRVLANIERSQRRADRVALRVGQHSRDEHVPDTAGSVAERARLAQALAALSRSDHEVLRLMAWEELDLAGAAIAMGCSRSTMTVRLHVPGATWERRWAPSTSRPGQRRRAARQLTGWPAASRRGCSCQSWPAWRAS